MTINDIEIKRAEMAAKDRERKMAAQREREKSLVPLRIDSQTVIYVTPDKCNAEYAEKYREKRNTGKSLGNATDAADAVFNRCK